MSEKRREKMKNIKKGGKKEMGGEKKGRDEGEKGKKRK